MQFKMAFGDADYYLLCRNNNLLKERKDVVNAKRFSGEYWQYDASVSYTKKNNNALNEYHQKLPCFYGKNGRSMEDKQMVICDKKLKNI